jgi:hypothetical protein
VAEDHLSSRRALLALAALAAAGACASAPEPAQTPKVEPLPPLDLAELAPRAGLVWLLRVRPRVIAQIPWLIPAVGRIVPEANFDGFRDKVGFDLRQIPEAVLTRHGAPLAADTAIVRHNVEPVLLERKLSKRLSSDVLRADERPDLVRVSGKLGTQPRAFCRIGNDIAVYQTGGDPVRGTARIASLYATKKLEARRALDGDPLGPLVERFGDAPAVAVALGPFEDEWKSAARGLLEIATAAGAAARPTAREHVGLAIALAGEFGDRASAAADTLRDAWGDMAATGTGRVLGLDSPIGTPVAAGAKNVVTLSIELDADRLTEGLRALVARDLEALMRLD